MKIYDFNERSSADEVTDRRDISSGIESKSSGRFGGEFRDNEEPPKRQDKEFRFDIDKSKTTSAKPTKKVDLGAAAFYKVEPTTVTTSVKAIREKLMCVLYLNRFLFVESCYTIYK